MSVYRFLADHYINDIHYQKGPTHYSTIDAGGSLPLAWVPTAMVDPLDFAAAQAFWSAGPQFPGHIFQYQVRWIIPPPGCRWIGSPGSYSLSGIGAVLGPWVPVNTGPYYVTENSSVFYVAEDGTTNYVTES